MEESESSSESEDEEDDTQGWFLAVSRPVTAADRILGGVVLLFRVLFGTALLLCGEVSMYLLSVRPSVCPSMGPQQQTRYCRFAMCARGRQEISIDCSMAHSSTASSSSSYLFALKHKISTSIQESRGRLPERHKHPSMLAALTTKRYNTSTQMHKKH